MKKVILFFIIPVATTIISCNNEQQSVKTAAIDSTLTLPVGFTASVFADSLGSARHLAFDKNGDLYVRLGGLKNGHGTVRLKDTNNDGVADSAFRFR